MPEYIVTSRINYTYNQCIKADSPEQAATIAQRANIESPREGYPPPGRVEAVEEDKEDRSGECWEVIAFCDYCGIAITNREVPEQPWNYKYDPEHGVYICYGCINGGKNQETVTIPLELLLRAANTIEDWAHQCSTPSEDDERVLLAKELRSYFWGT